jgi:HEPN domain-containing protein
MPHDAGAPSEWLDYAKSDLAMARVPLAPPMRLESLCFHAQQAAEKAVKAVLIEFGIQPPRVHDIRRLLDLLPSDQPSPELVAASAKLTDYAVLTRYPGLEEPVSEEEYREALRLAKAVVAWAEGIISAGPGA